MNKGQIFSLDLIFASLIFLLILFFALEYGNSLSQKVVLDDKDLARDKISYNISNCLVLTSGYPNNWEGFPNLENIGSIGLAKGRNNLDKEKIEKLVDLNSLYYDEIRGILGLGKYEIFLSLEDLDGQVEYEFGLEPVDEAEVSVYQRICVMDKKEVLLRVKIWE